MSDDAPDEPRGLVRYHEKRHAENQSEAVGEGEGRGEVPDGREALGEGDAAGGEDLQVKGWRVQRRANGSSEVLISLEPGRLGNEVRAAVDCWEDRQVREAVEAVRRAISSPEGPSGAFVEGVFRDIEEEARGHAQGEAVEPPADEGSPESRAASRFPLLQQIKKEPLT